MATAYCFVDGGYLRAEAKKYKKPLVNPTMLADRIAYSAIVQTWHRQGISQGGITKSHMGRADIGLARVFYYDARADGQDLKSSAI